MDRKFSVGQKVICINNEFYSAVLEKDKVYTVEYLTEGIDPMIFLKEAPYASNLYEWRFEDATKYLHCKDFAKKIEDLIE